MRESDLYALRVRVCLQAVLNNPEKVAYMKERIPLGRLGEPEDVVGRCTRAWSWSVSLSLIGRLE